MQTVTSAGAIHYVAKDKPHLFKREGFWECSMQYGKKSKGRKENWALATSHARKLNQDAEWTNQDADWLYPDAEGLA